MKKHYTTNSATETKEIAKEFAKSLRGGSVVLLDGDLGSGKTTFAQGILEALDAEKPYTSPTFTIMKTYDRRSTTDGIRKIHHIDTYRVEVKDILDLDWRNMLKDTSGIILLEWPCRVSDILPESAQTIHFEHMEENIRRITFA